MKTITLGSLFDGSGGFPLAGTICGAEPVWASEIELYPLRVTEKRFPFMEQLGDVTKIDGAKIKPVDVITFGSPCQDLSTAGKQVGIHDGTRSILFFDAVRIVKEMRGATNERHPTFAVWENVPGAFSSNKGEDFRAVLEALCGIAEEGVSVPRPPRGGKWTKAGEIVGNGYSVAWRTVDAQYFGVPQRRRRIYLVADFAGGRAGKILFEREGMRGNPAQSGAERQEAAGDAGGSAEGSGCAVYALQGNGIDRDVKLKCNGTCYRRNESYTETDRHGVVFMAGQGAKARGIAAHEDLSPTLRSVASGTNQTPSIVYPSVFHSLTATNARCSESAQQPNCVCYPRIARTLTAEHDASPCVDRGQNIVCVEGDGNSRAAIDHNLSPTLKTSHVHTACYPKVTGALCANSHPGSYTRQDAFNDMLPVVPSDNPTRKYIVRRLTPLECCRLQGFPDWWEDGIEGSESARYKMWGNGIALPCAVFVLDGIARAMAEQRGGVCE